VLSFLRFRSVSLSLSFSFPTEEIEEDLECDGEKPEELEGVKAEDFGGEGEGEGEGDEEEEEEEEDEEEGEGAVGAEGVALTGDGEEDEVSVYPNIFCDRTTCGSLGKITFCDPVTPSTSLSPSLRFVTIISLFFLFSRSFLLFLSGVPSTLVTPGGSTSSSASISMDRSKSVLSLFLSNTSADEWSEWFFFPSNTSIDPLRSKDLRFFIWVTSDGVGVGVFFPSGLCDSSSSTNMYSLSHCGVFPT
jgi:hypothetical protein